MGFELFLVGSSKRTLCSWLVQNQWLKMVLFLCPEDVKIWDFLLYIQRWLFSQVSNAHNQILQVAPSRQPELMDIAKLVREREPLICNRTSKLSTLFVWNKNKFPSLFLPPSSSFRGVGDWVNVFLLIPTVKLAFKLGAVHNKAKIRLAWAKSKNDNKNNSKAYSTCLWLP